MKNNSKQRNLTAANVTICQNPPAMAQVWSGLYLSLKVAPVAAVLFSFLGWAM